MVEQIITDYAKSYLLDFVVLRYFNVSGCDPYGLLGEDHDPETHLIPNILLHLLGQRDTINIYGENYDTPDGTCIRDFIHVNQFHKSKPLNRKVFWV